MIKHSHLRKLPLNKYINEKIIHDYQMLRNFLIHVSYDYHCIIWSSKRYNYLEYKL